MARQSEPMSEFPIHYFAYGSNLNRADMLGRCPGAIAFAPAELVDWRLTFRGVADIEPAPGRSVLGALWRLKPADLHALDRYEGAPNLYERRPLAVQAGDEQLETIAYVITDEDYVGLPSPWYFDRIAQGYADWGLSEVELAEAMRATREELAARGIYRFRADGRKRLRGLIS